MFNLNDAEALRGGGVGIIPTDTIYGIVASVSHPEAIERVYELKGRTPTKPCIILLADTHDLRHFPVTLSQYQRDFIDTHWPGPLSIILDLDEDVFPEIHRGAQRLAFRIPNHKQLREFLRVSGPLIAPSANREGQIPIHTITEARDTFTDGIDVWIDGGEIAENNPSTLIYLESDRYIILRQGAYIFNS